MTYGEHVVCFICMCFGIVVDAQPLCNLEDSDFSDIVKSPCFVDKTMMIKDILRGPDVISITVPRKFGKSTNLNMVKRFLEINVNEDGSPKEPTKTTNYKLFADNNLKIFSFGEIFSQHFGKYPVLFVDYKPLQEANSFETTLEKFRKVLLNSFEEHLYLVENPSLWETDLMVESFIQYIHPKRNSKLGTAEIRKGFTILLELLYKHFKRNVYVLFDEFDSYVENLIFQKNPDTDIILTFVRAINEDVFKSRMYVERVITSGVLRVAHDTAGPHSRDCYFLGDHTFTEYYGFTAEEVSVVLNKVLENKNESDIKLKFISEHYNGYNLVRSKRNIFSPWSLLNYLCRGTELNFFRRRVGYFNSFRFVLNLESIADSLEQFIIGNPVYLDLRKPFSIGDISELNELVTTGEVKNERSKDLFLYYLYQIGYLSPDSECDLFEGKTCVKIPNIEVLEELKSLVIKFRQKR